jgi:hypothetical protein
LRWIRVLGVALVIGGISGVAAAQQTHFLDNQSLLRSRTVHEDVTDVSSLQEQGPGRGDDLGRIKSWRTFLDRTDRAFFAARMNTEAVRAKITEADERIEELEAAPKDHPGGRSDITGDVGFLERADRAFTAARMNTADVKKWLKEAREKS